MSQYQRIYSETERVDSDIPHKTTWKQVWKEFKCYFWINFIQFGIEFDSLFIISFYTTII